LDCWREKIAASEWCEWLEKVRLRAYACFKSLAARSENPKTFIRAASRMNCALSRERSSMAAAAISART
jgi:hypothetical protein